MAGPGRNSAVGCRESELQLDRWVAATRIVPTRPGRPRNRERGAYPGQRQAWGSNAGSCGWLETGIYQETRALSRKVDLSPPNPAQSVFPSVRHLPPRVVFGYLFCVVSVIFRLCAWKWGLRKSWGENFPISFGIKSKLFPILVCLCELL